MIQHVGYRRPWNSLEKLEIVGWILKVLLNQHKTGDWCFNIVENVMIIRTFLLIM